MHEKWLPVVGFEDAYDVSDFGRVRSIPRVILRADGRLHRRQTDHRVLKTPPAGSGGYPEVNLSHNGRKRVVTVHTLVLEAFVGPRPARAAACHFDGDPTNNRLENLRWDSHAANGRDRVRHGRDWNAAKAVCPRGHALVAPNIRRSEARLGRRTCLACDLARKRVDSAARRGRLLQFEIEADRDFARVMGRGGR